MPLGAQEGLQERKASKAVMSFRQDPSSSVQAEPWSGKRTKLCAISECILAGQSLVNADFNSRKAARRCFLSSSSRFRSSCSAFISASNLLAEERAWAFRRQRENKQPSSLASEGEPKPELLPDEQHRTACCTSECLLGSSVRTAQVLTTLQRLGIYTKYLIPSLTLTSTKERSLTSKSLTSDQNNAISTGPHTLFP